MEREREGSSSAELPSAEVASTNPHNLAEEEGEEREGQETEERGERSCGGGGGGTISEKGSDGGIIPPPSLAVTEEDDEEDEDVGGGGEEEEAAGGGEEEVEEDVSVVVPSLPPPLPSPIPSAEAETGTGTGTGSGNTEDDGPLHKVRNLMRRVTAARPTPHPRFLHTLANILEEEESRFEQEGLPNARSTHMIGRVVNLIKENDEFFELISSKLLVEARFSIAVQAAAARLLLACMSCGTYPDIFDERVVANVKLWVVDDGTKYSSDSEKVGNVGPAKGRESDWEMLRTYATGLLAMALSAGGGVVEEVLTAGVAAKLMHYLRSRVLKEVSNQREPAPTPDSSRINSGTALTKNREDISRRVRLMHETPRIDSKRLDDDLPEDQGVDKEDEGNKPMKGENEDVALLKSGSEVCVEQGRFGHDIDRLSDENPRMKDGRGRAEEAGRGEPSKLRDVRERVHTKIRGKSRMSDVDSEGAVIGSPPPKAKAQNDKISKNGVQEIEESSNPIISESLLADFEREGEDWGTRYLVGDLDITDSTRKAARAAEAEARAANAPLLAVKAAGEAAAELVKAAAAEALATSSDREAALTAAAAAAASVVDAAVVTKALRNDVNTCKEFIEEESEDNRKAAALGEFADLEDCVPDANRVAKLRERFCVQCLEKLGEYLEVLGPVLHERGVDVCLALLQRESGKSGATENWAMLSDVLKLICALAAHRKFAALFVDRGGVQQLLDVPRVYHTFTGLSLCLFALASLQVVMERVCALPSNVVNSVVALALYLLECPQDHARRNAALFFGAAFVFRAILDAFDSRDGLSKMLDLLRNVADVRSGGGGSRNDRGLSAEVLTSSEKQIAFHTCIALRQFFRAHLVLFIDSLRPYKGGRGGLRNLVGRAAYKPLDLSNEAMENLLLQLQRDRKLGPAFVRARWLILEKFVSCNGHSILLELTQVAPGEKYLYEMAQYALNVLHISTLMPYARKHVLNCTLSNERSSMAVILDAASASGFGDPEVIQSALMVLANLVCPPPALCSRPPTDGKDRTGKGEAMLDKNLADRNCQTPLNPSEVRDRLSRGDGAIERNGESVSAASPAGIIVGDRRISLGTGAGGSGLAAYMEKGYRQAREAVRANNGIKVLLHLLHPRTVLPPASVDCVRTLACQVLLGLAKDDTIAHILTKLQVGKLLSELLRDNGAHVGNSVGANGVPGMQGRRQTELGQVAMELMAIVTNAGRASTLVASDAAAPTLRRIERAAIAAATPISYEPRELLLLIHQHLVSSGLANSATALAKEAQLVPLPPAASLPSLPIANQSSSSSSSAAGTAAECIEEPWKWPVGRVAGGFMTELSKQPLKVDDATEQGHHASARKRGLLFSSSPSCTHRLSTTKDNRITVSKKSHEPGTSKTTGEAADTSKTPSSVLPSKRKALDKDNMSLPPLSKRPALCETGGATTPYATPVRPKSSQVIENGWPILSPLSPFHHDTPKQPAGQSISGVEKLNLPCLQIENLTVEDNRSTPGPVSTAFHGSLLMDNQSCQTERASLDNLVVQFLKHQHRQCPAPVTTLPPLSLFHPHVCPEPSRASYAPFNTTSRLALREACPPFGGSHGKRRDRHFVYSRFRPWRICRDESVLLTTSTFLGSMFRLAAGSHAGDVRVFDCSSGNVLETHVCHQSPITQLQAAPYNIAGAVEATTDPSGPLLLSSGSFDVRIWNSSSLGDGPLHIFEGCKSARFNHAGDKFAAIKIAPVLSEPSPKEILLYDIETHGLEHRLSDSHSVSTGPLRGHAQSIIHFSPSDTMILWNGVLWDHRVPRAIHRFDQFTDYGGGGFHPAGNEVIINSEVWDMRSFKLLRSVPSLDQTTITFNSTGDVIYAILRRNSDDIMSALHPRRGRHPLFSAFRTMDAVDYTDIATTPVDRCILDLATEQTDSLISVVAMDSDEEMDSIVRLYEVGRRRSTEDDSDPDDVETEDEEESEGDAAVTEEDDLGGDGDDSDMDGSNDEDDGSGDNEDAEEEVDVDFDSDDEDDDEEGVGMAEGILEMISDGDDEEALLSYSSGDEDSGDDFNELMRGFF